MFFKATTSGSVTLSVTGIGLISTPISAATAIGLSVSKKVIYEIVMQKYNSYKKQYEKDQQTIIYLDKFYRKPLQDNLNEKNECKSLCNLFIKYLEETRNEFFYQCEHKNKINNFLVILC